MFSLFPWGPLVLLFCSPPEEWNFWTFFTEFFKLFPVKAHFFRRPFNFCTFCLYPWGFEIAPARGSTASVLGYVMTSRDYIKVEQVRIWLFISSLANFLQFYSECFFSILLQLISSCLHGSCSVFSFEVFRFFCFVLYEKSGIFEFFCLKSSVCSTVKTLFSQGPSFFVRSVCNHGALNLRLHVVALPASMAMSWPAEIR